MISKITNYTRSHPVGFTLSLVTLLIIIVATYITFVTIAYAGKVRVVLSVVPKDATIAVNGEKINGKTLHLKPAKYTISASKTGYESYEKVLYIDSDQKDTQLAISLFAKTDKAKDEQSKNFNDYLKNEGIAGKQKNADGLRFREKNPIVEKLPYRTLLYTIGYRSDKTDPSGMSIIIEVDTTEGRREDVIKQIERWGYDPVELNIKFRNYENPFNE